MKAIFQLSSSIFLIRNKRKRTPFISTVLQIYIDCRFSMQYSMPCSRAAMPTQPLLRMVQARFLIVEFNTPQLATENDQRIIARIQELWKLGQPAPTAYRRVGNYSVFVFDAPDEQSAKQLIDQVKYEQVVSWLGENPNILKEAQKRYVNTTLGVLVTVLKASGYALITCLGMGGLIGGLLFSYRRSQQKAATAYSDAGGMLRLNLDELTPETEPGRLLRERN